MLPNLRNISALILAIGWAEVADAVSLSLNPVADTTLIEVAPTNSNGGQLWVNAGTTQNGPSVRGLFRFDLTRLPTNALVESVSVTLAMVHQPKDDQANAAFGLYRLFRPWGEGTQSSLITPGQGAPAAPGDATWLYSHYATNAWSAPGGAQGIDFASFESSFTFMYGVDQSPYSFDTTPELVADVQDWVRRPHANFGWLLKCDDEGTIFTARRFGSREDTNNAPVLQIEFVVPPKINALEHTGSQTVLRFLAWAGQSYRVDYRETLATNSWLTLATVTPQDQNTLVLVVDTSPAPRRFYRLAAW